MRNVNEEGQSDIAHSHVQAVWHIYGVATMSRLLKMIGLFCIRALYKRRYSAKQTYTLKEPTNRSHPISVRD